MWAYPAGECGEEGQEGNADKRESPDGGRVDLDHPGQTRRELDTSLVHQKLLPVTSSGYVYAGMADIGDRAVRLSDRASTEVLKNQALRFHLIHYLRL